MPVVVGGSGSKSSTGKAISNAQTRLGSVGVAANSDSRNWFEKLTNLPEKQNFFFDALDLIQRPFQATTTGLEGLVSGTNGFGSGFMQGLTGEKKTSYSDILADMGIENKYAKGFGGFGLDLLLDPINLIPGAAIAKVAGRGAAAGGKAFGALEKQIPKLEELRTSLGGMFNSNFGAAPEAIARNQEFTNSLRYFTDKTGGQIADVARKYDANPAEVSRILEKDLKWTENPEELIGEIFKNRPNQTHSVNIFDGEHAKFIDDMNAKIQSSPVFQDYITGTKSKIDDLTNRISAAQSAGRSSAGYQKRLDTLMQDMDDAVKGIQYKPIGGGADGYKVFNPKPRIFKAALGDVSQFLDDIAPQKTFDDMLGFQSGYKVGDSAIPTDVHGTHVMPSAKITDIQTHGNGTKYYQFEGSNTYFPESQVLGNKATNPIRPIMDDLFRTGTATVKAGTPEADVLERLKEMFKGEADISSKPNAQGEFKIRLKPNSQFHGADLDKLSFTDRAKEININRPEREITQDVGAHAAAREIQSLFGDLRKHAEDRGVPLPDKEGYLKHELTTEQNDIRETVNSSGVGSYGGFDPGSRKYKGSIEDVNERLGEKLFTDDAHVAAGLGLKKNYEYVEAQSHFNDLMKPYVGKKNIYVAGKTAVPKGFAVVRPDQYKFFPLDGALGIKKGTAYMVPKPVLRYLDHAKSRMNSESMGNFVTGYDKVLNIWKALQFFSPAFHIRNAFGSSFNMFIGTAKTGGMSLANIVKYSKEAVEDLINKRAVVEINGQSVDLVDEFSRQGLKGSTFVENEFRYGGKETDKALLKRIENAKKTGTQKAVDVAKHPMRSSASLGHNIDVANKYAFYKWLREAKKLEPEEAAKTVRQVLFDYEDLTDVEKKIGRRVVPFYTWMKKNAVFQAQQFFLQPKKYSAIDKAYDDAVDGTGIDSEALPDWLKDSLAVPVSKSHLLNLNAPMADLNKITHPVKMLTDGLTPVAKIPLELTSNYNTFFQQPIESFEGEKKPFLGMDMPAKTAYLGDQFGLLRILDNILSKPSNGDPTGLLRKFDAEKARTGKEYDLLRQLEDLIRATKQDGTNVPTIAELGRK